MIMTCGNIFGCDYFSKTFTFNFNKSAIFCYLKKVKFWNGRNPPLALSSRQVEKSCGFFISLKLNWIKSLVLFHYLEEHFCACCNYSIPNWDVALLHFLKFSCITRGVSKERKRIKIEIFLFCEDGRVQRWKNARTRMCYFFPWLF